MWLDNASDVDILFYEPYADVITEITQNKEYNPLTIGVFGVWGAGKSTLLNLIQQKIKKLNNKGILCITINAWTFEGYEDAKVALMEALLRELKDKEKKLPKNVGKKISALIKKLDLFKIATKGVSIGAPIVASAVTGNPIPLLLSLNGTATDIGNNVKKAAEAVQDIHDNYLKDDNTEADENSIVNNVRKFRKEFSEAIQDDEIQSITVLIDDLDRCQPDRIIETLEAIKLFLSVDKMTFIIAADENVIQYSIRKKYPPLDNYAVNLDKEYIEKIIQLPIYIPELSTRDIENYLMLLVAQQYCSTEQFRAFLDGIRESKMMISETTIDQAKLKELIRDYLHIELSKDFAELADVISGIKGIVASNLKGNPRQAKRFMNTFITKKKLAELYYGPTEINSKTLAKLLVLQKLDNDLFIQLNEWNKRFSTENEEFKKMRLNILEGTSEDEKYNAWRNPSIRRWLESEPIELEKTRLDRYFYLTRENLKKADVDVSTLSVTAKEILERIGSATRSLIDSITDDMKALTPSDKNAVFSVVLPKIEKGEIELFVVRNLFVSFEAYREKIVTALEKYPGKIAIGSFAALKAMRNADKRKIDDLLDVWQKAGIIDQKGIDSIKSKEKK